ncbi:hypothetical protein D1AOALGA4SA_400 [Olavius algarvensis Delta 1 endosymbiont]|nr:hypothetical protein D1AOALGA4SA_400 [Olavius algarvensis Delta 1 endosymbiont]
MKTKSTAWKKFGIFLGILALILVIIGIALPMVLDLNRYHGLIVSEVEKAVGGKVKLGRISWGITHRIWLEVDGFSIIDASAFPGDIKLTRLYASVSIPPLLNKKVILQNLRLESSEVKFRLEPATNDPGLPAGGAKPTGIDLPVEIEIQQLSVAIKQLELDDALTLSGQTLVHVLSDVDLAATNVAPAETMAFNLSLRDEAPSGLGSLKAQGTFSGLTQSLTLNNPDLKLKAALNRLHVDAIKPYLKNSRLEKQLAGSISLEIDYDGDLGQNLRAQGAIDLSRFTYTNPSLWDSALPGLNTTATFQIKLDPQNLTAEKIGLTLGALSLDAQAVLHNWSKEPVIRTAEFSSDLPLKEVIPLIPWKQMGPSTAVIRPILEGGGVIALNKVVLPEISLSKPPANFADLLPEIKMTARVTGVSVEPTPKIPKIENIKGVVQLENGIAQVQGLTARLASIDLPPISGKITDLLEKPKIDANLNGRLQLDTTADETVQKLLEDIGLEKVVGAADLDLRFEMETARPADFQLQGNIGLQDFQVKTVYAPALLHGLNAKLTITPAVINLTQASTRVGLTAAATSAKDHFTLQIQSQVDNWRSKPSVTLRDVKTSKISLPLLALMVPWEKLGLSAKPIKDILDAGGFITVEAFSLPAIDLARLPKDPKHLMPQIKLATSLKAITVPRGLSPVKIEGITGRVNLADNVLVAENIHSRLGPIALPTLNIRATDIADHFKVALRAKGPLQVAAAGDGQVGMLLREHGLQSLAVAAEIDMRADIDLRKPKDWTAKGSLNFKDVRAQTHPAAVDLEDLKGQVTFSRKKTINITARDIAARVNGAPVRLSGKVLGIGSPKMIVSTRAHAGKVDLSHLAELLPVLKEMKLAGILDMDLDVHIPYSAPAKSRLNGTVSTRNAGFQLASSNLAVAKGNLNLELSGNRANINTMTMRINDQKVALSGHISNPVEPKINMLLTSPDLNLDRLLPPASATKPSTAPSKGKEDQRSKKPATDKKSGRAELPPVARKLTADLQVQADRGQYKGLQFEKLKLDLVYKRGVVERYDLNFGIDNGHIATKGSADLRNLDHIGFTVDPNISALPLAAVAPVLGIEKLPLIGPLTLKGQLRGRTGSAREILGSLNGNLDASLGPGNLTRVGKVGGFIAKLASMGHIASIFSGRLFRDLTERGIPFETISARSSFDKGALNLSHLHFGSDAMKIDGQGTIDLINRNLKMEALLVPMAKVDDALHYVPLVGKALEDVTKVRIDVEGPLEDPEIQTAEAKEIGKGVEAEVEAPKTIFKDIGKGLKKIF